MKEKNKAPKKVFREQMRLVSNWTADAVFLTPRYHPLKIEEKKA